MTTLWDVLNRIMVLSRKHPTLTIWVKVEAGDVTLCIPKGPDGDSLEAEWAEGVTITE